MSVVGAKVDRRSDRFAENARRMHELVADLERETARIARGGGEKSVERHLARGKLLPRDRIEGLLDPGSPFLELSPSPPMASTATRCRPPASSPASAGSRAASAWSSPTTRR